MPAEPTAGPWMLIEDLLSLAVLVAVLAVLGYGFLVLWRRVAESVREGERQYE